MQHRYVSERSKRVLTRAPLPIPSGYKHLLIALSLLMLVLAGCAPDDLDITPTATFTPVPTATPTPTPRPEGAADDASVEEELDETEVQALLGTILEAVPNDLTGGGVQWRRDFNVGDENVGYEVPRNVQNGEAFKVYYTELGGGKMNITYAVFDSVEDAQAHYEFIRGIRSVLDNGRPNDALPGQNLLGSGLYGSVGIFQIDNLFVEVAIEIFTTEANPLVPLARGAMNLLVDLGLVTVES